MSLFQFSENLIIIIIIVFLIGDWGGCSFYAELKLVYECYTTNSTLNLPKHLGTGEVQLLLA